MFKLTAILFVIFVHSVAGVELGKNYAKCINYRDCPWQDLRAIEWVMDITTCIDLCQQEPSCDTISYSRTWKKCWLKYNKPKLNYDWWRVADNNERQCVYMDCPGLLKIDCDPNPCQNGGTCTDKGDDYTCDCPAPFGGKTCATNSCNQKPDPGWCRGRVNRWYFNSATKQCEQFTYGGCNGNANNFETSVECVKQCLPVAGSKPHVVMFLIDDMGFNDIFWNNKDIKMPYTESLATSGKILDQSYSGSVCSPSRGTLMSGLYAHKIGMSHGVFTGAKSQCLKTDVKLLPQKLKDVGYKTHMVGKWHLGLCAKQCTPIGRGFDTFYGFYHGGVDHYTRKTVFEHGDDVAFDWHDLSVDDPNSWGIDNSARDTNLYSNDLITERSLRIIDAAKPEEPLFLYYSTPLVHTPMQVADSYKNDVPWNAGSDDRRTFIGMTKALDDAIKLVVEKLKAKNMYDNTVIIFHSDNGGEGHFGSVAPLRGAKASLYEGGIRVPSFIHSKLLPSSERGQISKGMFYIADWHSTIMELAGATDQKPIDGVPQVDFLFYGGQTKRTEFIPMLDVYFPYVMGKGAIRSGDYKLISGWPGVWDGFESNGTLSLPYDYDFYGINKENRKRGAYVMDFPKIIKYMYAVQNMVQMYNIKTDPNEQFDISSSQPGIKDQLLGKLDVATLDFYKFNLESEDEVEAGKPTSNSDDAWLTGWCPNGPLSDKF